MTFLQGGGSIPEKGNGLAPASNFCLTAFPPFIAGESSRPPTQWDSDEPIPPHQPITPDDDEYQLPAGVPMHL